MSIIHTSIQPLPIISRSEMGILKGIKIYIERTQKNNTLYKLVNWTTQKKTEV